MQILKKSKQKQTKTDPFTYLSIYLSLDTATHPRGHSRQVSAESVSIRQ